jgi:hypothetical protein
MSGGATRLGRLLVLDDPDLRTVASRSGDPDQLLKEIAF